MARYQVILAYDGTDFKGFQRQAGGARTVQGVVEAALCQLGWQGVSILAAGRTDTGVHASGQVIAFDLEWRHSDAALLAAINANLPQDVAARTVHLVQPGFHPRYDALARCYRYRLFCQANRDPIRERYAWRVWPAVDLPRLEQSVKLLTGTYDFAAFGAPPRAGGTTMRSVFQAGWVQEDDDLIFDVLANAFLYHMVRRLVGLQVAIGQGRIEPQAVLESLRSDRPGVVKELAPAHGLTLVEVMYPQTSVAE
ncbi:MAG: tRNA pseudouridine(38-40) synthase TruA [Anaerolineales bacterium]|nr:tRNA pseudouridine(38-40) synthase TruA [Anaerolineales bacterium]